MKIGLDISQIVYGTGVSVYTKNLMEALLKIDKENEYVLFFSSLRQRLTQISNLKTQNYNAKLKTWKKLLLNMGFWLIPANFLG